MTMPAKKFVPCGEWLPDQAEYDNPGSPSAANILWQDGHYVPALSFASVGASLPLRVQGATAANDNLDTTHIYAGTATKLYEYEPTGFVDLSSMAYTMGDNEYWKFAEFSSPNFGNLLFGTNGADKLQQINPGVDPAFSTTVAAEGTTPIAAQVANIGQFVVVADTTDPVNGHVPFRVQWCRLGDPTGWDVGTLAAQQAQAGEQYMNANYGPVNHVSNGGAFGLVMQERAITRMYYVGGDAIFDFTGVIDQQRGCAFPNSPVQIGAMVYFIAHEGFLSTDGQSVNQIGHGKVDSTFLADVSQAFIDRVRGSYDPATKIIRWCYCSNGNTTGIPDKQICYNYAEDKFTPVAQSISAVFVSRSFGYTMDTLDNVNINLDLINPTLDSIVWEGGNVQVGAFDGSNNYGSLTGPALTATIDTVESDPNPGGMTFFEGIRPIFTDSVGSGVASVIPMTRDLENVPYTVGAAATQDPRTGICNFRATARYVRGSLSLAGGFDKLTGMDVYVQPAGEV